MIVLLRSFKQKMQFNPPIPLCQNFDIEPCIFDFEISITKISHTLYSFQGLSNEYILESIRLTVITLNIIAKVAGHTWSSGQILNDQTDHNKQF